MDIWADGRGSAGLARGLILLALVWILIRAVQRQNPPDQGFGRESTEDELKRRYARGEIDRTEFERKLEDLRK